jgi:hypothetical protein
LLFENAQTGDTLAAISLEFLKNNPDGKLEYFRKGLQTA